MKLTKNEREMLLMGVLTLIGILLVGVLTIINARLDCVP